jgi:hypothetical protein
VTEQFNAFGAAAQGLIVLQGQAWRKAPLQFRSE